MKNFCGILLALVVVISVNAQNIPLPNDFRQQNLTEYNSSLLNPAFSFDRNNPSSLALWTRWQWQTIDADPTSLFFNYTQRLGDASAAGLGFFQHNTGMFLRTGGVLNFAHNFKLDDRTSLSFGLNMFGFQEKLADARFFVPNPIQTELRNDFIVQMAPGINLKVNKFNLGVTSENILNYNITTNERNSTADNRIFQALVGYDFELGLLKSNENAILRPSLYYKTLPGFDNQYGVITTFSTSKYWLLSGYNSFYGISAGLGARFFKRFSFGAIVELANSDNLSGQDPSIEFVTSYKFGKLKTQEEKLQEELLAQKEKQKEKASVLAKAEEEKKKQEALVAAEKAKAEALALQEKQKQAALQEEAARKLNEEAIAQRAKEVMAQKEKEALAQQNKEVVKVQQGEKYEEVDTLGVMEPGYYLIANVFGTKKYFEAFMADMKKKGLNPNSFYREFNKYIYVYLGKYSTISAARAARDSKLNGKYQDKLWIFRVKGQ